MISRATSAPMTSPPRPHVTCVLTTRDRHDFVRQAILYFLRQDYADRSLVIVDDGAEPVEVALEAVTSDPRTRYVRLPPGRRTRGDKRNQGCAFAPAGSLIAHWDDDDWIAPDRLSRQVDVLLAADADLCLGADALHYHPTSGRAWRERDTRCAPTLLYRKSVWERTPLTDRNGGEESTLIESVPSPRLVELSNPDFYVAVLHDGNTVGRNTADASRWHAVAVDKDVAPLLGGDAPFYVGLRERQSRLRRAASSRRARQATLVNGSLDRSPATTTSITLVAPFFVYDGYGSMAEHLALGLERAGARVHIRPLALDLNGTDHAFQALAARSRPEPSAPVLYFSWPGPQIGSLLPASGGLFVNTMWEGTRLPHGWAVWLNRARAVIVPTSFVADVCRASGVTVPIAVIPEGIDPDLYRYVERPQRRGVTTLMVGPVAPRKNTLHGIDAWKEAFADDREARLILKARFHTSRYTPDDPRITLVDESEPTRGIAHWYARADILMALGSEGFGLPLVEGMATGLPVIALDAAGQTDTIQAAGPHRVLAVPAADWIPYDTAQPEYGGLRPVPDISAVVERLRWVAEHRDEALELGRAASDWARRACDVRRKPPAVLDCMEEAGSSRTVLRRAPTIWTPSRDVACGIAEYASHLTGALAIDQQGKPARHIARLSTVGNAALLHVQHEWGLFPDDNELTARLRGAKDRGVPVVVTEHSVRPRGAISQWEREADALIALTESGAQRLRTRQPGQTVAWIPPGCPELSVTRKRGRGHVIGAFGFMSPHKGFWKLLDLLRGRSDIELLLLSHTRDAETEQRWENDARGCAVRRVREYLPLEQVARRLAAEADALVFWYDDMTHESASYAVRIGLASGVPILCSPTMWFRDLRNVTYQPAGTSADDLARGVDRLLGDDELRARLVAAAHDYCQAHRWAEIARRHRALWSQLVQE